MTARDDIVEAGAKAMYERIDAHALELSWEDYAPSDAFMADVYRADADAALTAMLPDIAEWVSSQRDAFLASDNFDPAWIAGWHAAVRHIANRLIEGWTP